jgi:hypothetical protein
MTKNWFIHSKEVVSGPYTTEQVEADLQGERWHDSDLIWWKGQTEWMPMKIWKVQLSYMSRVEPEKEEAPVWYLDLAGVPVGPLTQSEMFTQLKTAKNLGRVRLWSIGMPKWKGLFEVDEIREQLGLTRRENERAPLLGFVSVTRADDSTISRARAASISVGGMGVNDAGFLSRGEHLDLLIQSPEFPYPLRLQGDVVYVTSQGYAGIRFGKISSELHTILFDYVKRFNQTEEVIAQKAA